MKSQDEYLEIAILGVPMALGVMEHPKGTFFGTLTAWGDDDGTKIAFKLMQGRITKKKFRDAAPVRKAIDNLCARDLRIQRGVWQIGEMKSFSDKVKCSRCKKPLPRKDSVAAPAETKSGIGFYCLDQCVSKEVQKRLF